MKLGNPSAPPAHPEAHLTRVTPALVATEAYWAALCPSLTVASTEAAAAAAPLPLSPAAAAALRAQVVSEGFAHASAAVLPWAGDSAGIAAAAVTLLQHGWPPSFVLVYDQTWALSRQASSLISAVCGAEAAPCGDTLCW